MKNSVLPLFATVAVMLLAGCTSGTTYGTGKSHEAQSFEGLYNIFALKTVKPNIKYESRPELVLPANKEALPAPAQASNPADENWVETPEQRIANLRNVAPKAHERSGELPLEFMTRKKEGIKVTRTKNNGYNDRDARDHSLSVNPSDDVSEEVKRRRDELAYSTGVKRKYLTEPPTEYRVPSENAAAGDLGVTPEEVKKRAKDIRKRKLEDDGRL